MQTGPQVSVILPNYNHANYLKQRIDSILAQTYQNFELIILDDHSPDNSKEVIEQYRGHPKVSHIVYNEVNGGTTFKQWDKGINLAKGELIWIAESDDWCESTLLETLVDGFGTCPNCVLGYVQSYTILHAKEVVRLSHHKLLKDCLNGDEFINGYMVWLCSIFNASMAIFKKAAYYSVSKEYTSYRLCGDWIFWTEVARQGNVFISGKVLNYFRKHDKDVSSTVYASGINFIEEFKVLRFLFQNKRIDENMYKKALFIKYTVFRTVPRQFAPEIITAVKELVRESGYETYIANRTRLSKMKAIVAGTLKKMRIID